MESRVLEQNQSHKCCTRSKYNKKREYYLCKAYDFIKHLVLLNTPTGEPKEKPTNQERNHTKHYLNVSPGIDLETLRVRHVLYTVIITQYDEDHDDDYDGHDVVNVNVGSGDCIV